MSSVLSVIIALCVIFFGDALMSLFTHDHEVIAIGHHYFMIVGGFYIAFSTMFVFTGVFRGAGDTLIPMFITLCSLWLIRVPLAFRLSEIFGVTGIWASIPAAWMFGMVVSMIYFSIGRWKKQRIVTPIETDMEIEQ
jgi:Na+-driven multidrug efflux pump